MNVSIETDTEVVALAPEADATATTVIEVGPIGQQAVGTHDDYVYDSLDDEVEDDNVLIAAEYFDAGYIGSGELELDEDADTEGVEDAEILVQETAPEPSGDQQPAEGRAAARRAQAAAAEFETLLDAEASEVAAEVVSSVDSESVGPRAAARRARQAEEAAARSQRVEPGNRRHGVMGVAMALVLGYQMYPDAVPGGQVGVNVFLGALGAGLWVAQRKAAPRHGTVLVGLGLALLAFASFAPDPTNLGDRFAPLALLAGMVLTVGVTAEPAGPVARAFAVAPLRYLGSLSFALLGMLAVAFIAVPAVTGMSPNAGSRIVASVGALCAAALTMRQIERSNAAQIQRARHRNGYTVSIAAAVMALALGAAAPGQSNDRHNAEDFVAAVESVALPTDRSDAAAGLPFADRCWSSPPGFAQATCTFGNDDADVSVALTGDQSAGSWLPALQGLALAKGWRVTTYLAADCMPGATTDAACAEWSKRVGKAIHSGGYDLVVVAGETDEAGGAFGEALRHEGLTVIGMPDLVSPTR